MTLLQRSIPPAPATAPRTLRLRLGVFDLSFQSALDCALDDLAHLYRDRIVETVNPDRLIEVRSVRQSRRLRAAARYTILADGEELFTDRRECELLPYMEWAVNWRIIAEHHRYLQFHGAALERDGRGLILVGPSGAGKSTLAAALLSRGWRYFCDEFALIDADSLALQPFPKAPCVKQGSFDVIESLGMKLHRPRLYVKAFKGPVAYLSPADIGPDVVGRPCPIGAVCLVNYTGAAQPALTPINGAEAVIELSRQSFNRGHMAQRSFEIISRIVHDARSYRLESGPIDSTCRAVEEAI